MKLARFEWQGRIRPGILEDDQLLDLSGLVDPAVRDVADLFASANGLDGLAMRARASAPRIPFNEARLLAPVARPGKLFGVGMNYHSFVAAARVAGMPIPPGLIWFQRPSSCVTGPDAPIWLPAGARDLDYEVELAIVIGRRCRSITAAEAPDAIGGYTIGNDLTLRGQVARSMVFAKSLDTHTPLGPVVVTPEEIGDPHRLEIRTLVNGQLRQSGNTADMIVDCFQLVAELSQACILEPGDVILTGTADGCGIFADPARGLEIGDVVRLEIETIGTIENVVIAEPAP